MKLNELAVTRPATQIAKIFESHFDQQVELDRLKRHQLHSMYRRVRGVLSEHRSSTAHHTSERNPAYLKMMMMEQALAEKIYEDEMTGTAPAANAQQAVAAAAKQMLDQKARVQQELEDLRKQMADKQKELSDLSSTAMKEHRLDERVTPEFLQINTQAQQLFAQGMTADQVAKQLGVQGPNNNLRGSMGGMWGAINMAQDKVENNKGAANAVKEHRRAQTYGYYLSESEVQQAQVVLAAQDMVDKIQGMIEDTTEMQFKELAALVDAIRNQIGTEQAAQFNNEAQAALTGLVQNLQGSKQQLEQALGVVTGQAPLAMPGTEMPGAVASEPQMDANMMPSVPGEEIDAADVGAAASLGRERR